MAYQPKTIEKNRSPEDITNSILSLLRQDSVEAVHVVLLGKAARTQLSPQDCAMIFGFVALDRPDLVSLLEGDLPPTAQL